MNQKEKKFNLKEYAKKLKFADPSRLLKLIEQINFVPPSGVELPSGQIILENVFKEKTGLELAEIDVYEDKISPIYRESIVAAWKILKKSLKDFPELIKHIENSVSGDYFLIAFYEEYLTKRSRLRQFAKITTRFANEYAAEHTSMAYSKYTYDSEHTLYFSIKNYSMDFRTDSVIDVLQGVEACRLKICEICDRIFWAKRLDSKTDSIKCFRALKKSNYRKRKKQAFLN